jgi:hypothetical protein
MNFMERFTGGCHGILHWQQLDALWNTLRADPGQSWYVYAVGEPPPQTPVSFLGLQEFLLEIDALLRQEHAESYCGIVYVDHPGTPRLVKIFDPNQLGSSCGSSGQTTLPGWVLSLDPPVDLPAALPPTRSRQRWWQRLGL